jgi:hypothetical protein
MLRKDWRKKPNFNWTEELEEELQNGSVIDGAIYAIRKTLLI